MCPVTEAHVQHTSSRVKVCQPLSRSGSESGLLAKHRWIICSGPWGDISLSTFDLSCSKAHILIPRCLRRERSIEMLGVRNDLIQLGVRSDSDQVCIPTDGDFGLSLEPDFDLQGVST